MKSVTSDILKTIKYFAFFSYPPTFDEIYTFLPVKTSKKQLLLELDKLVKKKKLIRTVLKTDVSLQNTKYKIQNTEIYTLPQYSTFFHLSKKRRLISQSKLEVVQLYIKLISMFPQVKLVGISGSLAMMNAKERDDIDLFIIAPIGKMWTSRFIAVVTAILLGLKRKRGNIKTKDKVCLNLFFDDTNLSLPQNKRSEYTAHEVLQMKPIINKNHSFEKFLWANEWVFKFFPNASKERKALIESLPAKRKKKESIYTHTSKLFLMDWLEQILRKVQLVFINRHKTTEIVTDTQLWFFPDDFEKKLVK